MNSCDFNQKPGHTFSHLSHKIHRRAPRPKCQTKDRLQSHTTLRNTPFPAKPPEFLMTLASSTWVLDKKKQYLALTCCFAIRRQSPWGRAQELLALLRLVQGEGSQGKLRIGALGRAGTLGLPSAGLRWHVLHPPRAAAASSPATASPPAAAAPPAMASPPAAAAPPAAACWTRAWQVEKSTGSWFRSRSRTRHE